MALPFNRGGSMSVTHSRLFNIQNFSEIQFSLPICPPRLLQYICVFFCSKTRSHLTFNILKNAEMASGITLTSILHN